MTVTSISRSQPDLFPGLVSNLGGEPKVQYAPIHVSSSTFLAGLSKSIHRWFRLTPSFGPDLVQEVIGSMQLPPGAHIHDPFSGAGTTPIEAALEGFQNSCIEINPLLHFVNKVCLEWDISASQARSMLIDIVSIARENQINTNLADVSDLGVTIPPIHNVDRWWRTDVLHKTLCLKAAIHRVEDDLYRDFFRLALAGILVPQLTNVTLGKLQLHFIDRSDHTIDVLEIYQQHAKIMIDDLELLNSSVIRSNSKIIHGDSAVSDSYKDLEPIDAVITSPPYPNRYSYVWNTRPHLYMLDFITEAKEASNIDKRTIGGTWGTATSELQKGKVEPLNEAVNTALNGLNLRIRPKDNLMANYVVHYFNRLTLHLQALSPKLNSKSKLAYVIGNSWIKDEYVESDSILAEVIEKTIAGMTIKKIQRFRKRHSGLNLYESIIYAER